MASKLLISDVLRHSYIGSCRYEHVFSNAYPGRLHSIREINYFLENLYDLKYYLNYNNISNGLLKNFINLTFGNVFNSYLKYKTQLFMKNLRTFLNCKILYIEISSLEYASTKCGVIANKLFLKQKNKEFVDDYTSEEIFNNKLFILKKDDLSSVKNEVEKMLKILEVKTKVEKIFLIPHVNLLSKKTNRKIEKRKEINFVIDSLVDNFSILEKVDIWESKNIKNYYLEDILDNNYLNYNSLGNKIVYDFFSNKY